MNQGQIKATILLIFLFFLVTLPIERIFAAPSVSSVSGAFNHKNTVTITGSGFGTKATAAPVVWDDASTGTLLTDNGKWSGAWPNRGSDLSYITQYHTPMRGIALPHSHITRYIAGAHGLANEGYDAGYNVMFWKTVNLTSYPFTFYVSWYQIVDPAAAPLRSDWNLKTFDWSSGGAPYAMSSCTNNNWYLGYAPTGTPLTTSTGGAQHGLNDDSWGYSGCGGSLQNPDINGHSANWWTSGKNPLNFWMKMEMEVRITNQSTGYIKVWEDGAIKVNYAGRTDAWTLGTRSIGVGGYSRDYGPNHWRYFADAYLDYTRQRVVLANNASLANATIREVQIPTAWTDNSITLTSNLGQFQSGQTAYLYVIDANGDPNPTGYPVTIGGGGGGTTYTVTPSAGTNGTISPNTPQTVNSGSTTTFIITPNSGYSASVGGTCGGNLSGTTYTTNAITANCTVVASFTASGDTTPPTSPTNLAANATSPSSITVTWTASTDNVGVTGYLVERCQGSGCTNFTQVGTPSASPFVDTGLTANTFYNYHVRARDAANNLSGWSNVVGATTQAIAPVTELIIDNTDTATSQSGSWSPSTNFPGYYGTNYHYSPNQSGEWFEWHAANLSPGTYEVYAYWNANAGRPTDVSYLITHSGGTATRNNINQTQNGSQWNLLGTYTFGATGTVRVQSGGTGTEGTVADAVRFLKTTTAPCNTINTTNFSQSAYNSYGAPFDAFQTSTNLMNTQCNSADTHTINLTTGITGDTTRIVYTKGYWYDAVTTAWRQYTGTCTGALNGEWCQGSVSATITDPNVSTASSANPTYLVGMTCSVQGGSWKCGCRDTSCTNFSWQIQGAGL